MRDRRRTMIAALALLLTAGWLEGRAPLIAIDPNLGDPAPPTARAALDLGALGTVAVSWTIGFLR